MSSATRSRNARAPAVTCVPDHRLRQRLDGDPRPDAGEHQRQRVADRGREAGQLRGHRAASQLDLERHRRAHDPQPAALGEPAQLVRVLPAVGEVPSAALRRRGERRDRVQVGSRSPPRRSRPARSRSRPARAAAPAGRSGAASSRSRGAGSGCPAALVTVITVNSRSRAAGEERPRVPGQRHPQQPGADRGVPAAQRLAVRRAGWRTPASPCRRRPPPPRTPSRTAAAPGSCRRTGRRSPAGARWPRRRRSAATVRSAGQGGRARRVPLGLDALLLGEVGHRAQLRHGRRVGGASTTSRVRSRRLLGVAPLQHVQELGRALDQGQGVGSCSRCSAASGPLRPPALRGLGDHAGHPAQLLHRGELAGVDLLDAVAERLPR